MLEIKDLSVRYGKQAPTIEHFNLNMKKGEIISVVGERSSTDKPQQTEVRSLMLLNGCHNKYQHVHKVFPEIGRAHV